LAAQVWVSALNFCKEDIHTYLGTLCLVSFNTILQLRFPLVHCMSTTELRNKLDSQECNHCLPAPSAYITWNAWES